MNSLVFPDFKKSIEIASRIHILALVSKLKTVSLIKTFYFIPVKHRPQIVEKIIGFINLRI